MCVCWEKTNQILHPNSQDKHITKRDLVKILIRRSIEQLVLNLQVLYVKSLYEAEKMSLVEHVQVGTR